MWILKAILCALAGALLVTALVLIGLWIAAS